MLYTAFDVVPSPKGASTHITYFVKDLEGSVSHDTIRQMINQAHLCLAPLSFNDRNVTQGCCPIKVLEYLACGKPLVAANLPVVRELVCDGQEALLFTPDDPADLARCILTLLNDPLLAERLAEAGCQRVRREFTWEIAQQRLLGVYERLLVDGGANNPPVIRV